MSGTDFLRPSNTSHSVEITWADTHPSGRNFFPIDRGRVVFVCFWNFDIDSDEPKREHLRFIRNDRRFMEFVQRASVDRRYFTIEGRSSWSGDSHQNRTLSYQRALKIKNLIFDMPSYSGSSNSSNLLRGIRGRGSNHPINYAGLEDGGQEAYNRSVVIYWGDNNLNPLSRQDIERIGRRHLVERTGWSIDSMIFWGLWTPSHILFNHIVPAEIGASRETPSLEVLNRYKKPLNAYINESHLRTETEVISGIDRWLNDVKNARDTRLRQENHLRRLISSRMSGGGGSALTSDVARYEQFVNQYLDRYDSSCVFHNNYNLSRL